MRRLNDKGRTLIKQFEGLALKAYTDIVGVWTIGYGHTRDVHPSQEINQLEAERLLDEDLERFENGVEGLVTSAVNDNQFSALVSFAYNLGLSNLGHSTLLKKINNQDYLTAADEFLRWDKAGNFELPGLRRRREAERALFLADDLL